MLNQTTYDEATFPWTFDWSDQDCRLILECEFCSRPGIRPDSQGFDPGIDPELELTSVGIVGAQIGPDLCEASPEQLQELRKALRRDRDEVGRIEEYLVRIAS